MISGLKQWKNSILVILGTFAIIVIHFGVTHFLSQENLEKDNNIDLGQYDSKYTYIETNEDDTYDLYIYASAIQWKDGDTYKKIDNSIVPSSKEGFVYENASNEIKTYFPTNSSQQFVIKDGEYETGFFISEENAVAKIVTYTNLYGDQREAVCYELASGINLYVYPISTGFHMEYIVDNIAQDGVKPGLLMDMTDMDISNVEGKYILFSKEGKKSVIVYAPVISSDSKNQLQLHSRWELSNKDNMFLLEFSKVGVPKQGKIHIEFSVQIHDENMPDTTMYENKNENMFLSNYAIIGKENKIGEGIHYIRYRINYFFEIDSATVISAEYHTRNLNYRKDKPIIGFYEPETQWSSSQMTWDEKINFSSSQQNTSCVYDEKGGVSIGLTDYIKEAVQDSTWMTESLGSVVTCLDGYAVLATSDNGEYIPYLRITLSEVPMKVIQRESINETGG